MTTVQLSQQALLRPGPQAPNPLGVGRADSAEVTSLYEEQVAEIVDRLQQRYPREQISGVDLEGRVRGFYRQFSAAHIRTFVAIFVERLVRRSIEEPSVGKPGALAA